jgi:hypothetical protein
MSNQTSETQDNPQTEERDLKNDGAVMYPVFCTAEIPMEVRYYQSLFFNVETGY